jgi:hypothetical protein
MKATYGNYIIKLAFKGVSNCWFCSFDEYKKYNNCTIDNWKEQQLKKFNIDKKIWKELSGTYKNFTANHTDVSKFFEDANLLGTRVKGIQYDGKYDGDCLLIYDWTTAVPLAVSNDEGKTWEKVDKAKTAFQRNNFKNNDYIDTNKKIKHVFKTDKDGNINCNFKKIFTLEGAPKEVEGSLWCSYNNLTTLKGAPKEIKGDFWCSQNKLTTLKGAPQKVGGNFICSCNNLTTLEDAPQKVDGDFGCSENNLTTLKGAPQKVRSFSCTYNDLATLEGAPKEIGKSFWCHNNKKLSKEEIIKYLKVAKIGGEIYTDYGEFDNQKEALEKLTIIKESYFNY